ncbi:MAG TPA: chemotaxis protein CheA [Candidatus Hydrogenedens sp.]|nr:chemotaxis protein CheA [Candidatus Hydrogenedens sp.]
MAETGIETTVEKLSELAVFVSPGDLQELAQMHTCLIEIREWAKSQGFNKTAIVADNSADLVEKIVLQEIDNPDEALKTLSQVISCFQQIILANASETEIVYPEELQQKKMRNIVVQGSGQVLELPENVDPEIFQQFIQSQDSNLEEMESLLLSYNKGEEDKEIIAELKRKVHTLKGETGILGLNDIQDLCHLAEDRIEQGVTQELIDDLFALKDWLKKKFDAIAGKGTMPPFPNELRRKLSKEARKEEGEQTEKKVTEIKKFEPKVLEGDLDLVKDFVQEATEHLDNCDVHLLTLETDPEESDALNAVFRAFHTIKGVSGFLGLDEIKQISHEAENLLDRARKKELLLVGDTIDVVFEAVDALKECVEAVRKALTTGEPIMPRENSGELIENIHQVLQGKKITTISREKPKKNIAKLGEIMVGSESVSEDSIQRALTLQKGPTEPVKVGEILVKYNVISSKQFEKVLELQKKEFPNKLIGELVVELGYATEEDIQNALEKQKQSQEPPKLGELLIQIGETDAKEVVQALRTQRAQTLTPQATIAEAIKVDANRLDQLVDMIGELVIAESMVAREVELQGDLYTDLSRHVGQLDKITRELQLMAMSLRMIPIKSTFQKMARLVRDLSKKTGKLIEFHTSGEDTELDKTVVDKIGDPLVHMVRNSVDHGIESNPEERIKKGKPPIGNIYLRAYHSGGNIHIQVEDDGAGLNREAIIKKAIERGLIRSEEGLSDREIWNLIFKPGFSTAQVVTEVSGRGVGMDVVKKNIEALRGQVDIQSTPGQGTVFTIRLPLTLAIIDGMVVRVGAERYIIPTLSIIISLRPTEKEINTVVGKGEVLSFHGKLINLYRLNRLFNIPNAVENYTDGTVVVVEAGNTQIGLLVDEILGQQQIVIKSLGEALKGVPGIAGGAIMPDGKVGLILDIAGILKVAEESVTFV